MLVSSKMVKINENIYALSKNHETDYDPNCGPRYDISLFTVEIEGDDILLYEDDFSCYKPCVYGIVRSIESESVKNPEFYENGLFLIEKDGIFGYSKLRGPSIEEIYFSKEQSVQIKLQLFDILLKHERRPINGEDDFFQNMIVPKKFLEQLRKNMEDSSLS